VGSFYHQALQTAFGQLDEALTATTEAKERAEQAQKAEEKQRQEAETARHRERTYLYLHRVLLAHSEWRDNDVARAQLLLDSCPEDVRQWEWHYLKRLCRPDLLTLKGHTSYVHSVAFSPDGKRLASVGRFDRTVKVWDAGTGQEALTLKGHTDLVHSV